MDMTALTLYDYILCLDREYQYVWKTHKSKASRLVYLYIRYISLLNFAMPLATLAPISSDTVSTHKPLVHLHILKHVSCMQRLLLTSLLAVNHNTNTIAVKLCSSELVHCMHRIAGLHRACQ